MLIVRNTHDTTGQRITSDCGFATYEGHRDPLTGDRVLTAWTLPRPPVRTLAEIRADRVAL